MLREIVAVSENARFVNFMLRFTVTLLKIRSTARDLAGTSTSGTLPTAKRVLLNKPRRALITSKNVARF